ncbi:Peptidoglycan/xylan/chitin deacetylase, PgdA/CDA1 family [Dethiosulfatibacter aminovorans DSM 17477]|uniref:Peptidoglycan/xylan/chitin deacetylase, PgdA/CDA1 family n=1 Tax=Dethiosulfatibacter aminovorans DSM 17477 TaxID=1121476 RepID=A0A1M6K1W5_9FIRM|nr:polysaccharide deacetylase family protein [Dethiosulfatibacter aminovorans]SHJ52917.1 Peptidoglycan/xylan/chitin deacetylase, PgdA/CDA1 family [Dethiosulfatibacter aminovorans DSM 17477]
MKKIKALILLCAVLLATGCGTVENTPVDDSAEESGNEINLENSGNNSTEIDTEVETEEENDNGDNSTGENDQQDEDEISVDFSLEPNEAGRVMVLMYHSIDDDEAEYEISVESFKQDLDYLYEHNYRPIAIDKYMNGEIDTPAGYTPVILTFDDAHQNNFNIIEENGEMKIDPDSAIGIMEDYNEKYEDFNITATFFIFGENPFRQKEYIDYKIEYLLEHGYTIGNHSYAHENLSEMTTKEEVEYAIGREVKYLDELTGGKAIDVLAIPFGVSPVGELKDYMYEGNYEGYEYKTELALEVGWYPSYSVFDSRFDNRSVPRIRGSKTSDTSESEEWFAHFEEKPYLRFVSDGYEGIVTVPADWEEIINPDSIGDRELLIY